VLSKKNRRKEWKRNKYNSWRVYAVVWKCVCVADKTVKVHISSSTLEVHGRRRRDKRQLLA